MSIYKLPASILFIIALALSSSTSGCNDSGSSTGKDIPYVAGTDWTIMIYGDGDNDLENFLLMDVEEMKAGFINGQGYNLIMLADRLGYTKSKDGFNAYFTDTRLYRITAGTTTRIGGSKQFPEITTSSNYEANMGDATTLKKFIWFCKKNYPADRYALVLWNHGLGPMKKSLSTSNSIPDKGICVDMSSGNDFLYTAEITDVLTSDESVDLLGFDACLMGTIEVAYQYRPNTGKFSADIMAASAPSEWGYGWKYDEILKRMKSGGGTNGEPNYVTGTGTEAIYDPATMTAVNLCDIIAEEQYDSAGTDLTKGPSQSLSCYDLSKSAAVKTAVDVFAVQLDTDYQLDNTIKTHFEDIRGYVTTPSALAMHYFNASDADEWFQAPLFDLYDLSKQVYEGPSTFPTMTSLANNVMTAVDEMIIYSFGGSDYSDFINGKSGLAIFFPDGDANYKGDPYWARQWWYNAIDTTDGGAHPNQLYGKLAWCMDGTVTNKVENWFELLDKWYDNPTNPSDGGLNGYQW